MFLGYLSLKFNDSFMFDVLFKFVSSEMKKFLLKSSTTNEISFCEFPYNFRISIKSSIELFCFSFLYFI